MSMTDELLGRLGRALRADAVQPPADRVETLRRLVATMPPAGEDPQPGSPTLNGAATANGAATLDPVAGSAPYWPVVDQSTMADGGPARPVEPLDRARPRRGLRVGLPRLLSGALAAAAVLVLVAMVVAQDLPRPLREAAHSVGLPVDSQQLVVARRAADELELALARRNAAQVAEADASMLQSTNKLQGDELNEVRPRAVRLHVAAITFLRDNPSPEALSDLPSSADQPPVSGSSPEVAAPGLEAPSAGATSPPGSPSTGGGTQPATPMAPNPVTPEPPTVTIVGVSPRLDATFQVEFEVSGFALGPGQPYAVRFSFDEGREPTTVSGASPWRFPLLNAIRFHQVCAQVVDAAGVGYPASGSCLGILLP